MQSEQKKTLVLALSAAFVLALGAVLTAALLWQGEGKALPASAEDRQAILTPVVRDGMTGDPIRGALIVVPDTGRSYTTDAKGQAGQIPVPCLSDSRFLSTCPQPWGETTLLIYKEGYLPCALLSLKILPGETRTGPEAVLFSEEQTGNAAPMVFHEAPPREWSEALIAQYAP